MVDEKEKPLLKRGSPAGAPSRSPRFLYWLVFFLCTLVVAGATIEATDRVQPTRSAVLNQEWAVGCSIATFVLAFIVVIMHMVPIGTIFIVNTRLEGIFILILTAFMTSLVAIVSSSGNGLAVDQDGSVVFGNLYFSCWLGFILICCLAFSYLRSIYFWEVSNELSSRSDRLHLWCANLVACIILMASASNVFDHWCAGNATKTKYCNRCIFAIVDGFLGCITSIIVIGMKIATGKAPWILEFAFALLLFLLNAFHLGLITSEIGPGAKIGNVFCFSWVALIMPFFLLSATYDEHHTQQLKAQEQKEVIMRAQQYQDEHEAAFLDPTVQQQMRDEHMDSHYPAQQATTSYYHRHQYQQRQETYDPYVDNNGAPVYDEDGRTYDQYDDAAGGAYYEEDGRTYDGVDRTYDADQTYDDADRTYEEDQQTYEDEYGDGSASYVEPPQRRRFQRGMSGASRGVSFRQTQQTYEYYDDGDRSIRGTVV